MYLFILCPMKKYIFSALLLMFGLQLTQAQDYSIGIKTGPTFSLSRTSASGTNADIARDGSSLRFLIGAFVDLPFKENYFFHTGLNFASRVTSISLTPSGKVDGKKIKVRYSHEYLQLPLLLKLYTNEVLLDTKVFFNFGIVPELRLSTDNHDAAIKTVKAFNDFDLSGNFGGGIEWAIGVNTRIYAGLNYYIGFLNQVTFREPLYDDFKVKNDLFSLELGIRF